MARVLRVGGVAGAPAQLNRAAAPGDDLRGGVALGCHADIAAGAQQLRGLRRRAVAGRVAVQRAIILPHPHQQNVSG